MILLPAALIAASALAATAPRPADDWIVEEALLRSPAHDLPVPLLTLAAPGEDAQGRGPDQRPALLIVAGLDGRDAFAGSLARSLARELVQQHRELLRETTVYVVPMLHPDGRQDFETRAPSFDFGGRARPTDADRDRRIAEDGGEDLNGDGYVTMMRVENPAPRSGLVARHVLDPEDERLLKEADAEEGEIARYALLVEGIDDDGDGEYAEDGPGGEAGSGIHLDRDFPALWPELADGTEAWPLSQPETRALADWMLSHPNIAAVLSLGAHENLATTPATGKNDPSGRVPLGIEKGDARVYEQIGEAFREATGITGGETPETAGAFHHWAYAHLGLYSFATRGWARADLVKEEDTSEDDEASDEPAPEAPRRNEAESAANEAVETIEIGGNRIELTPAGIQAAMSAMEEMSESEVEAARAAVSALPEETRAKFMALAQGQEPPAESSSAPKTESAPKKGGSKSEDGKWLAESDARDGAGFVEWKTFTHPQLGAVEIGGFVPGFRHNPPAESWAGWEEKNLAFLADLLGRMPKLEVADPAVEPVGPGLWRIRVRLSNSGGLPLRSSMGVKTRRLHPFVCALSIDTDEILEGNVHQSVESIAPGDHHDIEWTVFAEDGSELHLEVRDPTSHWRHFDVALEAQR